ncbi:MAG: BTAD domain-containing putative transcriptional regulator, partial [Gemmatimonadaceae bacterium]
MFSLNVLGGASLHGPHGPVSGRAAQRHRLALLALLARARRRTLPRERLTGYLWPDSDPERARALLAESVYVLRKAMGEHALVSEGDALRLDAELVACDADEFEAAVQRGDCERAVAAYGGPFLDGLVVPGAPELERWSEGERARLAAAHGEALAWLATDAERRDDAAAAVRWWRAAAGADPYATRPALGLMRALEAAGDRSAALQHARVHAALVRAELEAEPDPAVEALAADIRRRPAPASGGAPPHADLARAAAPPDGPDRVPLPAAPDAGAASGPDEPSNAPGRRPPRGRVVAAGALAALLLAAAVIGSRRAGWGWEPARAVAGAHGARAAPEAVAVLPFSVRGGEDAVYLGEGMVSLLTMGLEGSALRAIDPHLVLGGGSATSMRPNDARAAAARLHARYFVLGEVMEAGGRLRITASLYDAAAPAREPDRAAVEGPAREVFSLADELARRLLGARDGAAHLDRAAAATTRSLPALKAFLEGEREMRRRRKEQALDAFERAADLDSAFALAHYGVAVAGFWLDDAERAAAAAERAVRSGSGLPERERRLLVALRAMLAGDALAAEHGFRDVVARDPEHADAWYMLGETVHHFGNLHGRHVGESREPFERVLALQPGHAGAIFHLLRIAAFEGRAAAVDSLAARVEPASSDGLRARAIRAFVTGDVAQQAWVADTLRYLDGRRAALVAREVAVVARDPAAAARLATTLARAAARADRAAGGEVLAYLALAQGR